MSTHVNGGVRGSRSSSEYDAMRPTRQRFRKLKRALVIAGVCYVVAWIAMAWASSYATYQTSEMQMPRLVYKHVSADAALECKWGSGPVHERSFLAPILVYSSPAEPQVLICEWSVAELPSKATRSSDLLVEAEMQLVDGGATSAMVEVAEHGELLPAGLVRTRILVHGTNEARSITLHFRQRDGEHARDLGELSYEYDRRKVSVWAVP